MITPLRTNPMCCGHTAPDNTAIHPPLVRHKQRSRDIAAVNLTATTAKIRPLATRRPEDIPLGYQFCVSPGCEADNVSTSCAVRPASTRTRLSSVPRKTSCRHASIARWSTSPPPCMLRAARPNQRRGVGRPSFAAPGLLLVAGHEQRDGDHCEGQAAGDVKDVDICQYRDLVAQHLKDLTWRHLLCRFD
jgi:hypothetical protein